MGCQHRGGEPNTQGVGLAGWLDMQGVMFLGMAIAGCVDLHGDPSGRSDYPHVDTTQQVDLPYDAILGYLERV